MPQANELVATPAHLVSELATHDCSIHVNACCSEVHAQLTANPTLPGVVVIDSDGSLYGLISRRRFMEVFSQPYRREVYFPRPLRQIIDDAFAKPLCIDGISPISDAARSAVSRDREQFGDPIAVAYANGDFRVLEMQDLLHALAQSYASQFRELEIVKDNLVQSEKMASLGGLVAGVAHEINTPVGVSLTAASFLTDKIEAFAKLVDAQQVRKADLAAIVSNSREASGIILHNMQRAAALVKSFKQVAADQTSESRRTFDLNESINQILQSLGPSFKQSSIEVHSVGNVEVQMDCYPGALSQIISNLILNAKIHAFAEGEAGDITVSAEYFEASDEVAITVGDNGKGIAHENLGRIFDPFFTTRRNQGGTGLGLHIVHNLVHNTLGGSIKLESELTKGSRFTVRFPRVTPTMAAGNIAAVRP